VLLRLHQDLLAVAHNPVTRAVGTTRIREARSVTAGCLVLGGGGLSEDEV
jgi:hypothetical protein